MVRLLGTICVGILPEGLAGIVRGACPEHERVAMLSHKGFCSVAIQAGTGQSPRPWSVVRPQYSLGPCAG